MRVRDDVGNVVEDEVAAETGEVSGHADGRSNETSEGQKGSCDPRMRR
jgi:hypothetical protein